MVQSLELRTILRPEQISAQQRHAIDFLATQASRGDVVSYRSHQQAEQLVTRLQNMGYGVTRDGLNISVYKQRPGEQLPHKVL